MDINSIAIIGQGNVASHLSVAFRNSNVNICPINSRNLINFPIDRDLYIISVSDDAIEDVASRMPDVKGVVVHTSGSRPMEILKKYFDNYGVFYPLQTFTKGVKLDYSQIPFFIEGSTEEVSNALCKLSNLISLNVYVANSELRRKLHIASVFACNYVNHLWAIADDLLKESGLSLNVLYPLINATKEKITGISPYDAQTGPAVRNDRSVIDSHLALLADKPDLQHIYLELAEHIINRHN